MVGRRLLLLVAVLMGLTALAASIAPHDGGSPAPTTAPGRPPLPATQTPAPELEPAAPATADNTLDETMSAGKGASPTRVRANLGQILRLQVEGAVYDTVVIDGLDEMDGIAPQSPARFDIYIDRTGHFPITLLDEGRRLGEIVVRE
jgi:hypothetical protein